MMDDDDRLDRLIRLLVAAPEGAVFRRRDDRVAVLPLERTPRSFAEVSAAIDGALDAGWLSVAAFCELMRMRLVEAAAAVSCAPAGSPLSGLRLARLFRDAITQPDAALPTPGLTGSTATLRMSRRIAALCEVPMPELPEALQKLVGDPQRAPALVLWFNGHCYVAVDASGREFEPVCDLDPPAYSVREWICAELTGGAYAPLRALAKSSPTPHPSSDDVADLICDAKFLLQLDALGPTALIEATVPAHRDRGLRLEVVSSPPTFRLLVRVEEHYAEADNSELFAHWPASWIGVQLVADGTYPSCGVLERVRSFHGWSTWDENLRFHPVVRFPGEASDVGTVCASDSVCLAGLVAHGRGCAPGAVLATELIELGHTFVHGMRSGNFRRGYNHYAEVVKMLPQKRPYRLYPAVEAHAAAARENVTIVPWNR